MHQQQTAFENIVEKEENACNKQFLLLPQCFTTQSENCIPICQYFLHHISRAECDTILNAYTMFWLLE